MLEIGLISIDVHNSVKPRRQDKESFEEGAIAIYGIKI
jgi:hypothetical protein